MLSLASRRLAAGPAAAAAAAAAVGRRAAAAGLHTRSPAAPSLASSAAFLLPRQAARFDSVSNSLPLPGAAGWGSWRDSGLSRGPMEEGAPEPAGRLPWIWEQEQSGAVIGEGPAAEEGAVTETPLIAMNRNAREPKKPNHGKRPCCNVRRKRKARARGGDHPHLSVRKKKGCDY